MRSKNLLVISTLVFLAAILTFSGAASAKSLYVIADINAYPDTPIQAFDIQGTDLV